MSSDQVRCAFGCHASLPLLPGMSIFKGSEVPDVVNVPINVANVLPLADPPLARVTRDGAVTKLQLTPVAVEHKQSVRPLKLTIVG